MNSKGSINYSCLIFSLPAVSCNFIFFLALILVRQEMRHRVNNGKQRAPLSWRASLYKNELAQVSDTIEAC